jgi:hypothetical protein
MPDQWYAVHEVATGRLVSVGTVVADAETLAADGLAAVAIAEPPSETVQWDAQRLALVPRAPAPPPDPLEVKLDQAAAAYKEALRAQVATDATAVK